MAKSEIRAPITMECTECKNRNYVTTKNRREHRERLELAKYCRHCRRHTGHRETR